MRASRLLIRPGAEEAGRNGSRAGDPDGSLTGTPSPTGAPNTGTPSAFQPKRCARTLRCDQPPPLASIAW
jgi:hypothetical protein